MPNVEREQKEGSGVGQRQHIEKTINDSGVALLRRPSLTVSGSLYCFIPDKLSYLITFR
jgi:hypothetical protein